MAGYKRIYLGIGTAVLTLLSLFTLLTIYGLQITSDGDKTCAGNMSDPCMSYITITNPTAKNIYVYNREDVKLDFSKEVKDYAFFIKDTRCGATGSCACTLKNGTKYGVKGWRCLDFTNATKASTKTLYTYMWPAYSIKQHLLVGFKYSPSDNIKWGFGTGSEYLDPAWLSFNTTDYNGNINLNNAAKSYIKYMEVEWNRRATNATFDLGSPKNWTGTYCQQDSPITPSTGCGVNTYLNSSDSFNISHLNLSNGAYCYDGDWNTYCYRGTSGSDNNASWYSVNYAIPSWATNTTRLYFRTYSSQTYYNQYYVPKYCLWNRTILNLTYNFTYSQISVTCLNETGERVNITIISGNGAQPGIYEEAMFWDSSTPYNLTFDTGVDGTLDYNDTANVTWNGNGSRFTVKAVSLNVSAINTWMATNCDGPEDTPCYLPIRFNATNNSAFQYDNFSINYSNKVNATSINILPLPTLNSNTPFVYCNWTFNNGTGGTSNDSSYYRWFRNGNAITSYQKFIGNRPVLSSVNFSLYDNITCGVLGSNGSLNGSEINGSTKIVDWRGFNNSETNGGVLMNVNNSNSTFKYIYSNFYRRVSNATINLFTAPTCVQDSAIANNDYCTLPTNITTGMAYNNLYNQSPGWQSGGPASYCNDSNWGTYCMRDSQDSNVYYDAHFYAIYQIPAWANRTASLWTIYAYNYPNGTVNNSFIIPDYCWDNRSNLTLELRLTYMYIYGFCNSSINGTNPLFSIYQRNQYRSYFYEEAMKWNTTVPRNLEIDIGNNNDIDYERDDIWNGTNDSINITVTLNASDFNDYLEASCNDNTDMPCYMPINFSSDQIGAIGFSNITFGYTYLINATNIILTPNPSYNSKTLTANWTWNDGIGGSAENSPYYRWYRNGALISNYTRFVSNSPTLETVSYSPYDNITLELLSSNYTHNASTDNFTTRLEVYDGFNNSDIYNHIHFDDGGNSVVKYIPFNFSQRVTSAVINLSTTRGVPTYCLQENSTNMNSSYDNCTITVVNTTVQHSAKWNPESTNINNPTYINNSRWDDGNYAYRTDTTTAAYDGDWIISYQIPDWINKSTTAWKVYIYNGTHNQNVSYTIPEYCWTNRTNLSFDIAFRYRDINLYCKNASEENVTIFDGPYSYPGTNYRVYEEGMNWTLKSPYNITIDTGDDDTIDYNNVSLWDGASQANNSKLSLNITAINDWLDSYCPGIENMTCYLPIRINASTNGTLEYDNLTFIFSNFLNVTDMQILPIPTMYDDTLRCNII